METAILNIGEILTLAFLFGNALLLTLSMWFLGKLREMDSELRLRALGDEEVRLDRFTLRCGVHVAVANWYLTRKARQLNAIKDVDELGDVIFYFAGAKKKYLQEMSTNLALK